MVRLAGRVAHIVSVFKILIKIRGGKRQFGRHSRTWDDNIKIEFK
jgi:hypothetical protein